MTLLIILGLFVFALLIVGNGVVKADADTMGQGEDPAPRGEECCAEPAGRTGADA